MSAISFTIPGRLGGKGRHRSFMRNGEMIHAEDHKTAVLEAVIKYFAAQAMRGHEMFEGAVELKLHVFQRYPLSWTKKKKFHNPYITTRPDADNQIKSVCDALNKVAWNDDAQVAIINVVRRYTTYREETVVTINNCEPQFGEEWDFDK